MISDTGYLEARRIRDLLVESNPDSRTFFGRLSGTAVSCLTCSKAVFRQLLLRSNVCLVEIYLPIFFIF